MAKNFSIISRWTAKRPGRSLLRRGGSTQDAPPQAKLPLSMLTPKNGKLGAWEVCIAWPLLHKGKWKDPQGVEKPFTRFECVLVSLHDPTQYCLGEVRAARSRSLSPEQAEAKFQDKLCFRISDVMFNQGKPEFNYCSHHAVVNLTTTKLERMLQPAHSPRPQPDIDCADCLALQRFQAFSITALVHEVSDPRPVDKDRVVRDVVICDGSKIPRRDADTLVEAIVKPTLQIFSGTSDAPMIAKVTAAAGKTFP